MFSLIGSVILQDIYCKQKNCGHDVSQQSALYSEGAFCDGSAISGVHCDVCMKTRFQACML